MPSSRWTGECETNIEQEHSPLLAKADHCPQVVRWTRASGTTRRERRSPLSRNCADKSFVFEGAVSCVFWRWPAGQLWILLGKGGEAAPSKAAKPPSPAQTGWLVQKNCLAVLNQPPRPRLSKERGYFLMGRPPLLCQGGESAPPQRSAGRYFS